jgi:hypothetical protein
VWCLFPAMREAYSLAAGDSLNRRQSMATWGILGLAVFVSVGMAEWSKRTAAGETVIAPVVMEEAVKIAARARDSGVKGFRGEGISNFEIRNSDFENTLSDLSVSAVNPVALAKNHPTAERETRMGGGRFEGANPSATAEAQRRGGVFDFSGNETATIQTSAGGEK